MIMYNARQVSVILDVDVQTVRKWAREKKLKATIRSKKEGYVITRLDLEEFVSSNPTYYQRFKKWTMFEFMTRANNYLLSHPELLAQQIEKTKAIVNERAAQRIEEEL